MKRLMNKPILVAVISFGVVWALTAGIAYGAAVFNKSLNASVNIVSDVSFEFYSDEAATHVLTQISLPDSTPSGISTFTVYLKNTGPVTETISAGSNTVPSSLGTLTLTFDGQYLKDLEPGEVCKVIGTLNISADADPGPINFTFSVNAVLASATASGQQLFAANCITCHSSGRPDTDLTQAQLINFIPSHAASAGLTPEEVAAIASYIKP